MKKVALIVLAFICSCASKKEIINIGYERVTSESFELDPDNVYNYHTGEKIPRNDFLTLVRGKEFSISSEVDSYGQRSKFYYDTTGSRKLHSFSNKLTIGDSLPAFNITSARGKEWKWDDLKKKDIIVQFNHLSENYDFASPWLIDLENQMLSHADDMEGFIFLGIVDNKSEAINLKKTPFNVVLHAMSFFERYGIRRTPTTLLVKNGVIKDIYYGIEEIDLERMN